MPSTSMFHTMSVPKLLFVIVKTIKIYSRLNYETYVKYKYEQYHD